ncbi:MAG: hypothetical protein DRI70_04105 [Bacteroidetes bacterium]|nr:MAG: hypothetical protein DRI70_04105 [Bacteroidota bacterium]
MSQRRYHYLVAGLPDLSFEEQKQPISFLEFYEELENQLHPSDYEQVRLVLLIYDNKNLISFLKTGETDYQFAGNYDAETFRDQVEKLSAILPEKDIVPGYMVDLIKNHYDDESVTDSGIYEKILAEGYYNHVMKTGTPFLKKMTEFDYNMSNLLVTLQTGKYNLFQKEIIVGDNYLANYLKRVGGKNVVPDSEFEFFNEIMGYAGNQSYTEAERRYDMLRWKIIDEAIFFEMFSNDWLLGYLLKLFIIRRWASLDHDSGEQNLRKMIAYIKEKPEII